MQTRQIILSNGTVITALASDYAGAAGSNHGFTSWDEVWAYTSERSRRLWEELTPVPTRRNSVRFLGSYAGWEGESQLLSDIYMQGVGPDEHPNGKGERLLDDLPVFVNRDASVFLYWDHSARLDWPTAEYYKTQKNSLRPGTFARLHENRWVTAESTFLTPGLWDPCVEEELRPLLPTDNATIFVGVDASTKHDSSAVVAVTRDPSDRDRVRLAAHRIWRPTPEEPLDIEATIEDYLRSLHRRYRIRRYSGSVTTPWSALRATATRSIPILESSPFLVEIFHGSRFV